MARRRRFATRFARPSALLSALDLAWSHWAEQSSRSQGKRGWRFRAAARRSVRDDGRRGGGHAAEALERRTLLAGLTLDVTNLSADVLAFAPGTASAVAGDGQDDAAAFQAAVDYVEAERLAGFTETVTIVIPEGTFDLAVAVNVDANDIAFEGAGAGLTTLQAIAGRGVGTANGVGSDTDAGTIDPENYLFAMNSLAKEGVPYSETIRSDDISFEGITFTGPTLHGAFFGRDSDGFALRDSHVDGFAWSGVRLFYVADVEIVGNRFTDAGGRRNVTSGASGGGLFISYLDNSVIANNRFDTSEAYREAGLNYFGVKGRGYRNTQILNNTIATGFSVELPFENDRNVEIAHNWMIGAVSIPKGGNVNYTGDDYSFHIHHNLIASSYSVELPRNRATIDSNVFLSRPAGSNFNRVAWKSFLRETVIDGPLTFSNNLVVNPLKQAYSAEGAINNVSFVGNEFLVAPQQVALGEATPDDFTPDTNEGRGLFEFAEGRTKNDGTVVPGTDYSTIRFEDNVFDILGTERPLLTSSNALASTFSNNRLGNVRDAALYDNPQTGQPQGIDDLSFGVGVWRATTIDANQIAADVRASGGVIPEAYYAIPPEPTLPPQTVYPAGSGVIDIVAEYGAIPDDGVDDTAAIQQAMADHVGRNRTLFLRDGVYNISDTLEWIAENKPPGGSNNNTTLIGESQAGTILKLDDNAEGFGDAATPKIVLDTYFGNSGDSFGNYVEELTIDIGAGNDGAIALEFQTNNYGSVRDVTLRSSDPDYAGHTGLAMALNFPGPGLIENVTIDGFDYGFRAAPQEFSITLDNIVLRNQRQAGMRVWRTPLQISRVDAVLDVPVLENANNPGSWGHVVLTDSTLVGTDASVAAIVNEAGSGSIVVRDTVTSGWAAAIDDGHLDGATVPDGTVDFYSTYEPFELSDTVTRGLGLPVERYDYETFERELPLSGAAAAHEFAAVNSAGDPGGQVDDLFDDTEAIQAALDSGAPVVFLRAGSWIVRDTLVVPPHVRRIVGADARITLESGLFVTGDPLFKIVGESEHGVSIEKIEVGGFGDPIGPFVEHASTRALALRDVLTGSLNSYANSVSGGKVFVDNLTGGTFVLEGQQMWARQLNLEPPGLKIRNIGGDLFILGLKTEKAGTLVETLAGGRTEVLGGLAYPSQPNDASIPMFVNHESSLAVSMPESSYLGGAWYDVWVEETRDGVVRKVVREDLTGHSNLGRKLGWYSGVLPSEVTPADVTGLTATTTQTEVTLSWDAAADARRYLITRDGKLIGATTDATTFVDAGRGDSATAVYTVTAESPTATRSAAASVMATTVSDLEAASIRSVRTRDLTTVVVAFSEEVDTAAATFTLVTDDAAAAPVGITEVFAHDRYVRLTTDALIEGQPYLLTIDGVADTAAAANATPTQTVRLVAAVETDDGPDPVVIRTSDGDGADTTLRPHREDQDFGASGNTTSFFSPSGPFHATTLLRFDLSGIDRAANDIDEATLALTLRGGTSGSGLRVMNVFGVRDDLDADGWTETGDGYVTWSTAPAHGGLPNQAQAFDSVFLGTITIDNTGFAANNKPDLLALQSEALRDFLADDTDGLVSIYVKRTDASNEGTNFWSKEGDPDLAPSLAIGLTDAQVAAPAVSLAAVSDTGASSTDSLTRLNNGTAADALRFVVDGVADGDLVTVYADQTAIGTAVARGGSAVVLSDGLTELADGERLITATRMSESGVKSDVSTATTITVDTVAPTLAFVPPTGGLALEQLDLLISEAVDGLDADDVAISRDGAAIADDAVTLAAATLGGLGTLTRQSGRYRFDLDDAATATDLAGNALQSDGLDVDLVPRERSTGRGRATIVSHDAAFALDAGEVSLTFRSDTGRGGLFSKDHRGYGDGGHLTIDLVGGRVRMRLQSATASHEIRSERIELGREYDLVARFGPDGMELRLDGITVGTNAYAGGLAGNVEDIAIGASKAYDIAGINARLRRHFDGRISDVQIRDAAGALLFGEAIVKRDITAEQPTSFNGVDQFLDTDATLGDPSDPGDGSFAAVTDGAFELTFATRDRYARQTLFSIDSRGFDDGGHLTVRIARGRVEVRLQSDRRSYILRSAPIATGVEYDLRIGFGAAGLTLSLDGQQVAASDYTGGLVGNDNRLLIGASQAYSRSPGSDLRNFFDGTMRGFAFLDGSNAAM